MMKVQPMKELIAQMRAVAHGKTKAPDDAAEPSVESVEVLGIMEQAHQDSDAKGEC
jgi:hypothetical protein